jgi:nucleoside 2-deoxyribosyltransferase
MSKIYIASSCKNKESVNKLAKVLQDEKHEVYNFTNPEPGNNGFSWSLILPAWKCLSAYELIDLLNHPIAKKAFLLDWNAMRWADTCIMLMPCGRSAHIEAGYFVGAGKTLIIVLQDGQEPDLMHKMATRLCTSMTDAIFALRELQRTLPH